ncbi:Ankyrin repeat protein [uncultured virus]|nr:Ankyrin repeat protein [uncultured virus]
MCDLQCPILHDWLEDPVTLPCCGKAISRIPLLQSIEHNPSCPLCRDPLTTEAAENLPTSVNLAYLVEDARKVGLPPVQPKEESKDSWKAKLSLLKDEYGTLKSKIGQIEISNDQTVYRTLLLPVIDRSGSMSNKPMEQVHYSLRRLLDLTYAHRNLATTVIAYDDKVESHEITTVTPRSYFENIFNNIGARGGTSFGAAFKEIVRIAALNANVPDITSMTILFLTDGEDSSVPRDRRHELVQSLQEELRKVWISSLPNTTGSIKDFVIHSVGFGSNHDYNFLNSLRLIGTQEGAYRYADPAEDDDILSGKINSILDVISQNSCIPLKLLATEDIEIIGGANSKFWIKLHPGWNTENGLIASFSLDNQAPILVECEIEESSDLWSTWYSKCIDDIASELLSFAKAIVPIDEKELGRRLHLEILTRRVSAILCRLDSSSANHIRLSSLMSTLESLKKGEQVNERKLNDMKFEGQFATKTSGTSTNVATGSSAHVSTPGVSSTIIKKTSWPIFKLKRARRCNARKDADQLFIVLGSYSNRDAITWLNNHSDMVTTATQKGSNALHIAAAIGKFALVNTILDLDVLDVNDTNDDGYTALDLAVIYGYWKTFDLLIDYGGKFTLDGQLMLRSCISRGYTELASRLLKNGLCIITDDLLDNVPTSEGLQWLSVRSTKNLTIEMAISKGALDIVRDKLSTTKTLSLAGLSEIFTKSGNECVEIVRLLLSRGIICANETISLGDDEITFPLFVASEKGCLPMVKLLLEFLPKHEINRRNNKGTTCLWISACNRHVDVVYELLDKGADPNIANLKGDSALISSCQKGSDTVVNLLLEAGIRLDLFNPERDNPVLICCRTGQDKILETLFMRMPPEQKVYMLIYYTQIDGFPPLLAATELNKVECIKVCVKHGADLNWHTLDDNPIIPGATALHLACHYGRLEAARVLCELGSDVTDQTTIGGYTPLHVAIRSGHISIVRYLIGRNRDLLSIADYEGRLPEYYTSMQGREEIREEFFTDKLAILFEQVLASEDSTLSDVLMNYGQSLGCYNYQDFTETNMGQGSTLLSLSLIYGNIPLAKALERMGANLEVKDDFGITPEFWKSYLLGGDNDLSLETRSQLSRVQAVSQKSMQNKMLTNLSGPLGRPQLTGAQPKILEFRKKMTDGFNLKLPKGTLVKLKAASGQSPPILGFLEKLKNNKVFPEGKGCLEQILWESRVHIVKLLASGDVSLDPMHMLALYLYTGNATVFTQVNLALGNYTDKNLWSPFIICLYQAILMLPIMTTEVYRGVDYKFESELYTIGTRMTWSSFAIASEDWKSTSELIKEKRGIIFIIKSKSGRDISRYSRNPVDREVIFLPGAAFVVTAIYRPDVIALGQANIRGTTFTARDTDIRKAAEGQTSIIIELEEN